MLKFIFCFLFALLQLNQFIKPSPVILGEDNWTLMLKNEWIVQFYAPWCPACKSLQPVWHEFAEWGDELDVNIGSVDITACPGLSGRFMITALPSIYHVKDGVFRQYRGPRDRESLISYLEEHKWSQTEPVSSWRAPNSPQMAVVSHFFRFSMVLRNLHQSLTEQRGVPVWLSYVLFVAATVLVGSLLGLVIVCCVDTFCGSRASPPPVPRKTASPTPRSEQESDVTDESGAGSGDEDRDDSTAAEELSAADNPPSPHSSALRKRRTRKAD